MHAAKGQGTLDLPVVRALARRREACPAHALLRDSQRLGALAIAGANIAGAVAVFVLSVYVVPAPRIDHAAHLDRLNLILFVVLLPLWIAAAALWAMAAWRRTSRWLAEDRAPTPEERDATIRFPKRLAAMELGLWVAAAVPFVALNGAYSATLGVECAIETLLGGLTTCALAYLLDEKLSRPVVALALERTPVEQSESAACLAVRSRLGLTWVVGTLVPLVAVMLVGAAVMGDDFVGSHRDVGMAVVVVAAVGVVVGLIAMLITARTLADPLRALRGAVADVAQGRLETSVRVDDASEVGMLQAGFNRMVHGLRERERLIDLFGRQVGEDVAREALEREDVELGGETRDAAVLFVDLIGSTSMATRWEPHAVVSELNAFFAIVVDTASLHGGWVNKFEGDAALCVFGAPTSHPDPAGAALAAARTLRTRLERELPDVEAAIGVSAGPVVAGNVGAAERYEYTVIGDPVNEAARLTELAKQDPNRLLASGAAVERARDRERARWRAGDAVTLRGRELPTVVATPS
jgi:adenylate cyclase